MKNATALELIIKYTQRKSTAEETELVNNWYNSLESQPDFLSTLTYSEQQQLKEDLYNKIMAKIGLA